MGIAVGAGTGHDGVVFGAIDGVNATAQEARDDGAVFANNARSRRRIPDAPVVWCLDEHAIGEHFVSGKDFLFFFLSGYGQGLKDEEYVGK